MHQRTKESTISMDRFRIHRTILDYLDRSRDDNQLLDMEDHIKQSHQSFEIGSRSMMISNIRVLIRVRERVWSSSYPTFIVIKFI